MKSMTIRCLVIDDEPLACDELKYLLSRYKDIRVEGEAESASEAEQLIKETKPDLIFLDIRMEESHRMEGYPAGLLLAERLTKLSMPPYIIFVTAHSEYAVKGYKYEPLHYILKPIEDKMLEEAIKRARKLLNQCDSKIKIRYRITEPLVSHPESYVEIRKIVLIHKVKDTDTAEVYLSDGNVLEGVPQTLAEFENKLNDAGFFRVHTSYLVNLIHVRVIKKRIGGDDHNLLLDGIEKEIPISRAKLEVLREALDNYSIDLTQKKATKKQQ